MIFTSTNLTAIQRSITEARIFNADKRQEVRRVAIEAYRGEQLDNEEWIGKYISKDLGDIPYSFTRLTRAIVDKRSLTYKEAPERLPQGSQKVLPDTYLEASATKDVRMKTMERYTNLLGVNAMMPVLNKERKRFTYHIINEFRPYFLPEDTHNPYGILYLIHQDTEPTAGHFNEVWAYWDPEFHFLVDGEGKELLRNLQPESYPDNPFGILPITFAHAEEIVDDFWTAGMEDVVHTNQMIDINLTELNYALRYQAFGQLYVAGKNVSGDKLKTGYDQVMIIDGEDVTAGVLNFNAPLDKHIQAIRFQIELLNNNNSLTTKWKLEGNPASGFSLMVQNIELLEAREDDLEMWRMFEKDLYAVEKVVWEKSGMGTLPEGMSVNFVEPSFPLNPNEQRDKDEWELEKGLVSIVDLFKKGNPDSGKSDDQIKQMLIDNATLNKEVKPAQPVNALAKVFGGLNMNNRRDE